MKEFSARARIQQRHVVRAVNYENRLCARTQVSIFRQVTINRLSSSNSNNFLCDDRLREAATLCVRVCACGHCVRTARVILWPAHTKRSADQVRPVLSRAEAKRCARVYIERPRTPLANWPRAAVRRQYSSLAQIFATAAMPSVYPPSWLAGWLHNWSYECECECQSKC